MDAAASAPVIRRVQVAAVATETRARVGPDGTTIALDIGGVGSMTATAIECVSTARDDHGHHSLDAIAGEWAWGQMLGLRGTFAFHGATLERDGYGLAIFGAPRAGTSLTALALSRRGWHLVADGTCPIVVESAAGEGEEVLALPGDGHLQVDRAVTAAFPPQEPFADAQTPRVRTNIAVSTTGPTRLDRIVVLLPSNVRRTGLVVPANHEGGNPALMLAANAVLGAALREANPTLNQGLLDTCSRTVSAVPFDAALIPAGNSQAIFDPGQIATLISEHIVSSGHDD